MAKFSPELEAIRKKYRKKTKRANDPSDSDFRRQERQSVRPAMAFVSKGAFRHESERTFQAGRIGRTF